MRFRLGFRVILPALMAVAIFGGPVLSVVEGTAHADLYLNDPYPLPGGDQAVSLSDALFIQQSLEGTGCELRPVVDTDGDGAITAADVLSSLQNYGCNFPPCNLPGPTTGTPIEIIPEPGSPTFGLPGQTLVLTATVSNTVSPSLAAQGNCGDNSIVVDLDPFIENDGIPVIFEITEDTGGGAYLGTTPGATTLLTWVNSSDPFNLSTGAAQVDLTLGNSGTVRVVARTRLLTNPPVWDSILQTFQADFAQITVTANIQITSPADGTTLCPADDISTENGFQIDVTVMTTAYEGSILSLLIDGFTTAKAPVYGGIHTFTSVSIPEGPHTLVASALGDYSPPNAVIVDLSPPALIITSPSTGDCINSSMVTVNGTVVEDGSGVAVITVQAGAYSATGKSLPIALNVPVDGNYSVIVRAEDNCGNVSDPYARNITIDATPLLITLISPTNGPDTGGIEVVIEGSGFTGLGPVSSVTFGGVTVAGFTVDNDTRITVTIPSVTAGTVDVVISDDCGNTYTCVNCFEYFAPVYYAVIVGDPSDVSISSITVAPNANFQVMIYGSVLIGGQISPDLGGPYGAESLGAYDFRLRHEVSYLTVNGITETGISCPDPGCEFDNPLGILSNTDEGDGYATSSFNDLNNGGTGFTGPTGIEIPLAILNFTAADKPGTTVISIFDVIDYESNTPNPLDTAPRRALTVNIVPQNYAVSVGSLTSAAISSITVAPYSTFSVRVYGSVLIDGEASPDLGLGAESLGAYDFNLRHEVAYLTINGLSGSGAVAPNSGYEFNNPVGSWSNTDEGDGYSTLSFNDINYEANTTPTGTDIPLATVTFSTGTLMGPTTIYISEVLDYQSNNFELLDKTPRRALRVNIAPKHYAVIVGVPSGPETDTIIVPSNSDFSVMIYGSVLINGEVSPDLGFGAESMGSYDFNLRHEVAYLTINGISGSGVPYPAPGCEFTNPLGILSNTDEGDGYATSTFNDLNNGITTLTGPVGTDISLATVTFSAGTVDGPTTIYISEVPDYQSNNFEYLDRIPRRALRVNVITDTDAPLVFISSPISGQAFNTTTIIVSGTASDSGGIGIDWVKVNGITATGIDTWTVTLTGLSPGVNTLTAIARDNFGNSGQSAPVNITVDLLPPFVSIYSPSNGSYLNTTEVIVVGTASDPPPSSGYQVIVNGYIAAIDGNNWIANVTLPGEGPHTITAQALDLAGNTDTHTIGVILDLTAPLVAINSPSPGSLFLQSEVVVSGSVSDLFISSGIDRVAVNGVSAEVSAGSWVATLSGLTDGPLTLQARAWDNAGNSNLSAPVGITIDTTPPLVFISSPTNGQAFNTTTITVSGTATDQGSGIDLVKVNGITATGTEVWTAIVTGLTQGVNILTATAEDIAGYSGESAPVSITIDSIPPLVAITSPINGTTVPGPEVTVRGTVSDTTSGVSSVVVNGETATINYPAGTFMVILPNQLPGPLTIIATATDLLGNKSDSSPVLVHVEFDLLSVFITSPLNGALVNTSNPTVEGVFSALDPGDAVITVNGITASTITTGTTSGSFTATLTVLVDGPYTIMATVDDGAETESDTIWITVDTTEPLVTITTPTHLSVLNTSDVVVSGTVSDATSDIRWVTVNGITADLDTGNYTATLIGQPDGPLTIRATARDEAGNTKVTEVLVTIDTIAPLLYITTPFGGEYINTTQLLVTGTVTDPAPSSGIDLIIVNGQTAAYNSGNWSVTLSLSEGPHTITAQAWDQAGNPSPTDSVNITVDSFIPAIVIESPTDGSYLNTTNVVVTGTVTDPAPSSGIGLIIVNGQTAAYNSGTWSVTLSLSEGPHTITAQVWDQAGNPSPTDSVNITVDSFIPAIVIESPTDGSYLNTTNVVVTGTVTDPAPSSGIDLIIVNGQTAAYNSGTWSVTLSLSEGPHTITAQVWDTANNQDIDSINITIDINDPLVAITSPTDGALLNTDTVVVSGTATDTGSGISLVTVNGQSADYYPGPGTWSITLTGLSEGPLTLIATAVDNYGRSTDSIPVMITIDYTSPLISITSPDEGDIITTDWLTVTGTASDTGSGISLVTVNGQSADYYPGPGTWSITLSGLTEGELEITASATDNAGNYADCQPVEVTVDYTPPLVVITSPVDGTTVGGPTVSVNGTVSDSVTGVKQVIVNGVTADVNPVAHTFVALLPGQANNSPLTIIATATDNANNQADSAPVRVMVKYTELSVTITEPLNGVMLNTANVDVKGVFTPTNVDIITVNGQTATIMPGSNFEITLSGQPEGPLTITAEVIKSPQDPAQHTIIITLDFTPPFITITEPSTGALFNAGDDTNPWLNDVQITVTVSTDAEDGQLAKLTANGTTHTAAVSGGIGIFSDVTLIEGPNTLIAEIDDQAGNPALPDQIAVFLDTVAPAVSITYPTSGSVACTSTVIVSGTVSDPAPASGIKKVIVNPGAIEANVIGENWTVTLLLLPEGSVTIDANAQDNSDNSTVSSPVNITVDYTPPAVVITSPSPGDFLNTSTVTLQGTAEDDPGCGVALVLVNGQTANGTYTWSFTFFGEPQGPNTYSVEALDYCSYETDPPVSINITVDHTAPSVSISTPTSGAYFCTSTVIVSGTANDQFSLISLVKVNGVTAAGGGSWTVTLTNLANGSNTITATAYDQAGNSAVSSPINITTDSLAPVVTILSPTDGSYVNSTTVTVSGTATDFSGSGVAVVLVNGQTATGMENWSIIFTGQTGSPSYSAVAVDYCGIQSSPQVVRVTVDLDIPTAELVSPAEESCWTSSAVRVDAVCNDTGGQLASCQVRIDGGLWYDVPDTVSGLSDGPHTAEARALDHAGNESLPYSHNFTVDTTPPIVSISTPSPDSWLGGTVIITGTVSDAIGVGGSAMLCLAPPGEECVIFKLSPLATPTYSESGSLDADFGDVDGDEDLDIVVANHNGQNRLYINDGNGIFTDGTSGRMPLDSDLSYDVDLADVDGNLALDIFISNYGQNRLYLNNGSGIFTDGTTSRLPADSDQSRDAEFGDVNKDGYPDIVIANYNGLNHIYLNDGSGYFTKATGILPEDVDGSFDIELGDVDKDQDLDIFVSNWGEQNRLYLNNGSGIFSDGTEHLPEDTDYSRDADLIDVSGDSYPDLVIANYFGQNRIYINDGNWSGTRGGEMEKEIRNGFPRNPLHHFIDYTTVMLPPLVDNSIDVDLADIDGDGDSDLLVANYRQQNRLYLNDGRKGFTDITDPHLPADINSSRDVDFGDVDGDGDPDIIVANYYERNLIYINNYGTVIQTVTVESVTGGGVFTGTFTQVAQDSYTATVISWDNCGNSSSATVSFNVDTTLPLVSITSPTNGELFNSSTLVVAGTATDADSGIYQVTVNGVSAELSDGTWVATLTGQSEGSLTLIATATDTVGNYADSSPITILIDYTPPTVSITYPTSGACINSTTVVVNGMATDDGSGVSQITVLAGTYSATDTSFPITLNIPADGVYTITAQVKDNCGNIGLDTVTNVEINTIPPTGVVSSPGNGECISVSTITVEGTADPDVLEITATWGIYSATSADFPVYLDVSGVGEQTNDLVVSAVDYCGNVGLLDVVANVQVDTVKPTVSISSPLEGTCFNTTTVWVDGTADDGTGSGIAWVIVTANGISGTFTNSEVDFPVSLNITTDGDYALDASAEDNCGNISDPDTRNITVDATPLVITNISPSSGPYVGGTEVVIEGSGFAGTGPVNLVTFGGIPATNFTVDGDTQITVTTPSATLGTVDVIISDYCGNAYTCFNCFEYTPVYYAVIVGEPSDVSISSITVAPNANFQVMIYGSVLIDGQISPDLGGPYGNESLGAYDFRLRHEIAYLTVNGITKTGTLYPEPGCELDYPDGTLSNTDEGYGYATSMFNDLNNGVTTLNGPLGLNIPLAILNFTAEDKPGTTVIYISDVVDYQSNSPNQLDTVPRRALTVNIVRQNYAVSVGSLTSAAINSITVAPNSTFSVKIYGSVLINGEVSPDLGSGAESLGNYDFKLRHEVAYLTINGLSGSGVPYPNPGCEFNNPLGSLNNTDDGDGYATSIFNDMNNGATTMVGPLGVDIPLSVITFSAGGAIGPTTIYISEATDYQSSNFVDLDTTPRRVLRVNVVPNFYAVIVGNPSGPATDTIVVPPSSNFNVMIYGSVLVGGDVSPTESLGVYDFRLRHEVAYLTINGITKTGTPPPLPGYEFYNPDGILSNIDEGDGYAISSLNDINYESNTTPTGTDIPLAVVNFSTGIAMGPTTVYISEVVDYQSNDYVFLDTTPRRPLSVKITDDSTPPDIQISLPADGDTVNAYSLVVGGNANEPESWIDSVTVNGIAADISALPDWTATMTDLPEGPLTILAEAINGALLSDQDSVAVTVKQMAAVRLMAEGKSEIAVSLSANPTFTIDVLGSVLIGGVLSPDLGFGKESLGIFDFRVRHKVAKLNLVDIKGSGIDRAFCPTPGCEFDEVPIFTISNSDEGDGYATSDFNGMNNLQTGGITPIGEYIPLARLVFSPVGTGTTTIYISGIINYESNNFEYLDDLPRKVITVIVTP